VRLERTLPLLTGGTRDAPERQRTLRATIAWSYDLLELEARDLLPRLSVFAGSFSIAAAERVCNADLDLLQSLVESNLLKAMPDSRLFMLETIREFAGEKLMESGAERSVAQLHAEHYHSVAEELRAFHSAEDQRSFESDQGNFRVALEHLITSGPSEYALEMVDSLGNYWVLCGQLDEGERWTERALAAADERPRSRRAWAISSLAEFARFRGDDARAIPIKEDVLSLARELDDTSLEAATLHDLADTYAHAGDYGRARELALQALEIRRRVGRPTGIAHALSSLFDIELLQGNYDEALRVAEEVAAIESEHAAGTIDHSLSLFMLGEAHRRRGEAPEAVASLRAALSVAREINQQQNLCEMLLSTAGLSAKADPRRAAELLAAAETIRQKTGFYLWDPPECERIAKAVRAELGEEEFALASADGVELDWERAISGALEALDSLDSVLPRGSLD
jgi:tetratricopeptide (TPR) repeat protein